MNRKHNFKELQIWKKGRALVKEIYQLTSEYPQSEIYGLVSQMRRASVSIPSNIAEGSGRKTSKEFSRFLEIAYSSSLELETQLYVSCDLSFISESKLDEYLFKIDEVQKMISSFDSKILADSI
ncbi:four helix bundle protein [Carboxylicivirga sediminis]|uniref:Four helix bundle protein n=1 Tax=Carboxylicivirga sediminis TaxID=2006564 RepID=A0A941F8I2_9BACT|nr:four helix bundle protein [Carboxylicivirga sediminis]MBR8537140.1 four helix bundle protein [Carboxylicivirga sediminis]